MQHEEELLEGRHEKGLGDTIPARCQRSGNVTGWLWAWKQHPVPDAAVTVLPLLLLLSPTSPCHPNPPRWCHTGPGTAPTAGGATWGHHGDPVPCFGVSQPAVPPYLHQGAQGLHVGLLGVQQRHDDVFPHVLPGEKTHGCFGVTRGGGAACRGCLGRLNTGAARLEPSSPALPLQPDGGIRED